MFTIKYTLLKNNGPFTRFIVPRKLEGESEIVGDQAQAREVWKKLLASRSVNGEAVDFIHTALIYGGTIKDKNTVIEFRVCEKMPESKLDAPIVLWNPEPLPVERKGEEPKEVTFAEFEEKHKPKRERKPKGEK